MKPAASLGAVLELLRALNWMIRADVPWPTKRGQCFDFVLVGEPGVFALWVYEGEPEGVEEAAAGLSALLGGMRVRPVICRGFASLGNAHPDVLYCTPETALDLMIGLPPHEDQAAIRAIATNLRDLEVPIPPEPEPEPEPAPVIKPEPVVVKPPKPEPRKVEPRKVEPPKVQPPKVEQRSAPPVVKVAPPTPTPKPVPASAPPAAPKPVVKAAPAAPASKPAPTPPPQATPAPVKAPELKPAPAPSTPTPVTTPKPEPKVEAKPEAPRPLPAGRHRSERTRFPRRTPPPPPAAKTRLPKSTLELPTALAPTPGRVRGGNKAAERFTNDYVYVPEPAQGPGPLKREFRAKPFITGLVAVIAIVVVAGLGVKAWPQLAGLIKSDLNPSASFGQTITTGSTNFHPKLTLSLTLPRKIAASQGLVSYSVDFSVSNVGAASWELPSRAAFVLVDSLGESHGVTSISGVASSRWSGTLKPTQTWSGRLLFKLKSGRTPLRLRFALATNGSESATWHRS